MIFKARCINDREFLRERKGKVVLESGAGQVLGLTKGKVYVVTNVERGWYRIVDDTGEDYLYPRHMFEFVN